MSGEACIKAMKESIDGVGSQIIIDYINILCDEASEWFGEQSGSLFYSQLSNHVCGWHAGEGGGQSSVRY